MTGISLQIIQPTNTANGRRRYSNGATADISPTAKAWTQKYWPMVAEIDTPTASTQPQADGHFQNQIAGPTRSRVEKSANWVRIISGFSESDSRRTSRIEVAEASALSTATRAPGCRLPLPGRTITSTPMKPTMVADQRRHRTFSRNTNAARTTENSGWEKASAVASASGSIDTA